MWLARNWDGRLYLYSGEPPFKLLDYPFWVRNEGKEKCLLRKDSFPEVKWSDEEPTKVKLVIEK